MLYRVYNQGEIPVLGHGWRSVIALPPGRKWIALLDWTTLESARLEVTAWARLGPQPDDRISPRKVRTLMRRRLRYASPTRTIEEALRSLRERSG